MTTATLIDDEARAAAETLRVLTPARLVILFTLDASGALTTREVADRLGLDPTRVSVALWTLWVAGHVERERRLSRPTLHRISARGKRLAAAARMVVE